LPYQVSIGTEKMSELQNVERLEWGGKTLFLVGTAHVSAESVRLVEQVLDEVKPDTVAVELCASRFEALRDPDRWKKMDIVEVLRSGRGMLLFAQLILIGFQRKIGSRLEVKPGADMLQAIECAERGGYRIVLADRDVRTTLKRIWSSLSLFGIANLFSAMFVSLFSKPEVSAEDVEKLKQGDMLEEALREFSEMLPGVRTALIDERDQYLCAKIRSAEGRTIVGVVGAAHVPGIKRNLNADIDITKLDVIPPKPLFGRIVAWGISICLCLLILYILSNSGTEAGIKAIGSWLWITAVFGALGALVALAHPFSIAAAFLTAPLTPLNPIIKSGRVTALVEAVMRRPRVSDFESLPHDSETLLGLFRNRISRILLVMLSTTVFTWVGIIWGTSLLASYVD
jgi:pheromone shutdown-related protein TraB